MAEVGLQREEVGILCEPLLFEPDASLAREKIQALETVLPNDKKLYVPILNQLGFTQRMDSGVQVEQLSQLKSSRQMNQRQTQPLKGMWE